jgi:hypothetical protein
LFECCTKAKGLIFNKINQIGHQQYLANYYDFTTGPSLIVKM